MNYNTKHSFVKLKNINDFNLMKEHHKKFNSLNNLKPRKIANKNKRLEVLIHVDYIYSKLYNRIVLQNKNTTEK